MLKLCKKGDEKKLLDFCGSSLFGSYISCRLLTYGFDFDFSLFWLGETDGKVTAAVSSLDGNAVVLTGEDADIGELSQFVSMLGFSSVMYAASLALEPLGYSVTLKKAFLFEGTASTKEASSDCDMREVYRLASSSIPDSFPDTKDAYLHFLSDFTFRKNRGRARVFTLSEDEEIASCALTCAECDSSAVLSCVACREDKRGKGLGKKTVLSLCSELSSEGKKVYVIALNEAAEGFYKSIGFAEHCTVAFAERKNDV